MTNEKRAQLLSVAQFLLPLFMAGIGYYFSTTVAPVATMAEENKKLTGDHSEKLQQLAGRLILLEERNRTFDIAISAMVEDLRRRNAEANQNNRELQKAINDLYVKLAKMERDTR